MNITVALKSVLGASLDATGVVDRRIQREGCGKTVVLAYHRILPDEEARKEGVQAGMYVEPRTFAMQLRYLKDRFTPVPLHALMEPHPGVAFSKPRCVLTFDDGWSDFRVCAFPLLREAAVPSTVFLPTDYVGTRRCFWTDRLAFLFRRRMARDGNNGRSNPLAERLESRIDELASQGVSGWESAIELLKTRREEEIDATLRDLASRWGLPPEPSSGRFFLSWEEARELKHSGLVDFGSHTATHRILTTLNESEVKEELHRSLQKVVDEGVANMGSVPLCYPNGDFDHRIVHLAQESGYSLAVTTRRGWNGPGSDRFTFRRVSMHQDMTSTSAMLGCRILGIF